MAGKGRDVTAMIVKIGACDDWTVTQTRKAMTRRCKCNHYRRLRRPDRHCNFAFGPTGWAKAQSRGDEANGCVATGAEIAEQVFAVTSVSLLWTGLIRSATGEEV